MELPNLSDLLDIIKFKGEKREVAGCLVDHSVVTWSILPDFIHAYSDNSLKDLADFFPKVGDEEGSYGTIFEGLPEDLQEKIRKAHAQKNSQQA